MIAYDELVENHARLRKEANGADAMPLLLAVRDSRVIATLEAPDLGEVLSRAKTAAARYRADALAVVFEGVIPPVDTHPATGLPWQCGDAERARLHDDGVA